MSHVANVELEVKDLDALEKAAKALGMELRRGQKTFRWWGTHVGDYPLPAGFTREDMGRCEHALVIPDKPDAYEVGVAKRRDGKPGYVLLWDFYGGGRGLEAAVGKGATRLKTEYTVAVSARWAARKGLSVVRTVDAKGRVQLVCTGR